MPELITGTKGTPHVTSTQDRSIYEKIIGKGSYILDDNELLEPELQSNQSLRIRSGMLYHHGSITEVKRNTYDEVTIANGSQGMKRIDLVVLRYTKNPETEVEDMNWVVIQGTPAASDPVAPAYTEGNMQEGDLTDDCPVFEVHLDGIQVTEVVKLLKVLDGSLESLNSKMFETGTLLYNTMTSSGTITLSESIENYKYLRVECCALASGNSLPKNITYVYIPVERVEYDANTDRCFANSCIQTPSTYYCVDYNFPDPTHIKILNSKVDGWSQARFWRVYGIGRL